MGGLLSLFPLLKKSWVLCHNVQVGGGGEIQVHQQDMVVHIYNPSKQEATIEALLEVWGWLRLWNKTLYKKKKKKSKQNKTQNRYSAHSASCGVHFHYMKLAKYKGTILLYHYPGKWHGSRDYRQKATEDCMRTFNKMNVAIVFDDDGI